MEMVMYDPTHKGINMQIICNLPYATRADHLSIEKYDVSKSSKVRGRDSFLLEIVERPVIWQGDLVPMYQIYIKRGMESLKHIADLLKRYIWNTMMSDLPTRIIEVESEKNIPRKYSMFLE